MTDNIYLLGESVSEILGSKLPSKKQVLQFMCFAMPLKKDVYQSAKATFTAIEPFWVAAGVPTMDPHNCANKIKKYYESYLILKRSSRNKLEMNTALFKGKERNFVEDLDNLFDVSRVDLRGVSKEAQHFLMQQRMKGRPGTIIFTVSETPTENSLFEIVDESVESILGATGSSISIDQGSSESSATSSSVLSSGPSILSNSKNDPDFDISQYEKTIPIPPLILNKRFITPRVVGALDRFKISDVAAAHLFIFILMGLGLDPNKFVCSRSSIRDVRSRERKKIGQDIKDEFKFKERKGSTVHWDGKQMENITTKEKHERLPVKLTHQGEDQLLGVPEIDDGTGLSIATAVYNLLVDWDQVDFIQCCCFDTTSSNTGCWQGAHVRLEQLIGRSLLSLPCRHHISEVLLGAVFEIKVAESSGPEVLMFKAFQAEWNNLNHDRYKSGVRDRYVKGQLRNENLELLKIWIREQLTKKICRYDYRELLELCLLFLGEPLPNSDRRTKTFHRPGAVHHARWMAKAIYSLKMFLFREQYHLSEKQRTGIADICVFIIRFYVVDWFRCVRAIEAPLQDLNFMKKIYSSRETDPQLSDEVIRKFSNHLWYLAEENIAFAFFDKKVPVPEKRKMVARLSYDNGCEEPIKRVVLDAADIKEFVKKELSDFVTSNTMKFFERFDINTEFLNHDPSTWLDREDYNLTRDKMKLMKVVNDTAERGVKLMHDYNKILSRNELEKQFILLVVSKFRALRIQLRDRIKLKKLY